MPHLPAVYIVSAARTPIGAFLGSLSARPRPRPRRDGHPGRARPRRARRPTPSRRSSWATCSPPASARRPRGRPRSTPGIPNTVPATTVEQGLRLGHAGVIFGAKTIALGDADLVVAGGMESMSNVPYYLEQGAHRLPHGRRQDRRRDDLRRPLGPVQQRPHGHLRRQVRRRVQVLARASRTTSPRRASAARSPPQKEGLFDAEIEPVSVPQKKGDPLVVKTDEGPGQGRPDEVRRPSSPRSRRTGRSPRRTPRASTTARARSSSRASARSRSTSSSRSRASSATAARRRRPSGSRRRRPRRSTRRWRKLGLTKDADRPLRDQRGVRGRRDGRAASSAGSTRSR